MHKNIIPIYPSRFTTKYLSNHFDIEIFLFTQCNLNCDFCEVRDKHWNFNVDYFDGIKESLCNLLPLIDDNCKTGVVKLCGGEMFFDKLINQFNAMQYYLDLIEFINNILKQYRIQIQITTNLVHHNIDNIISLYQNFDNIKLNVSFDFGGRFTKQKQIDLWWENYHQLLINNINFSINIIGTRVLYDLIIQNKYSKCFDDFKQNNTNINILEYFGNNSKYLISADQFAFMVSQLYKKYGDIICVNKLTDKQCANCAITNFEITPEYVSWDCCNKLQSFHQFFLKNNCIQCEYFANCRISCGNNAFEGTCFNKTINQLCFK